MTLNIKDTEININTAIANLKWERTNHISEDEYKDKHIILTQAIRELNTTIMLLHDFRDSEVQDVRNQKH